SGEDGWVEVYAYSLWPGSFEACGTYQGSVSGPRTITFSSNSASALKSWFKVEPKAGNQDDPKARADGKDAYTVSVTLNDSAGHPVNTAGATVVFTPKGISGAQTQQYQVISGSAGLGLATLDLTSVKAGTWEIQVKAGDDALATQDEPPVQTVAVEFLAGPGDAAHSRLVSPIAPSKANGAERQVVTAQVADSFDNPVAGAGVVFEVPSGVMALTPGGSWESGPTSVTVPTSGDPASKGVASLALTSTKVGSFNVTAQVGGEDVTEGSPARATFANADLSLGNSLFTIPDGATPKTVGTEFHTPTVTLMDESKNVYTPALPVTFYYRLAGTQDWKEGDTVETQGGVAVWNTFTRTIAGTYEVRATVPTGQVPDANTVRQAVFQAGAADLDKSFLTVSPGPVVPNDSATYTATLTLWDRYENPVSGATVEFTLTEGDEAHFVTQGCEGRTCSGLTTSPLGKAAVEVASPQALTTTVMALLGPVPVDAKDLVFEAGDTAASESSWTINPPPPGPLVADGDEAYDVVVTLHDEDGAPVDGGEVHFVFDVPGVTVTPSGPWEAGADGLVKVKFTSEKAASYTVNAVTSGNPILGADKEADQKIGFVAGAASLDEDKTFLTPPISGATVGGTQVVTATVQDAKGNPVTNAQVRFAVPEDTTAPGSTEGPVDANGRATLTLTSTKAGNYGVTAQVSQDGLNWKDIEGGSPAQVRFAAGAVSGAKSKIYATETGTKPVGGAPYTVVVELMDQYSNPVRIADQYVLVEFRLVDGQGNPVAGVPTEVRSIQTDGSGAASTDFSTTKAGIWRATATTGGAPVEVGSPVDLVFTPGTAHAGASSLSVTSNSVLANGEARHGSTVTVKDAYGNPVPGAQVKFVIDQGAPGIAGPTLDPGSGEVKAGPDGTASVYITSFEPGSFPVSATIADETVAGSGQSVTFDSGPPDPSKSRYDLNPDTAKGPSVAVIASGDPNTDYYTLKVTVRSKAGILVPSARVRLAGLDPSEVFVVEAGGFAGATGTVKSDSYGTYTWRLYSDQAGEFTGSVQVATGSDTWGDIAPEPFTLRFAAGTASATHSWLAAPAGPVQADGQAKAEVRAHVRDDADNDVDTGTVEFTVPEGATAWVDGTATQGGENVTVSAPVSFGYASVWYSSTKAATATVGATVGGAAIDLVKNHEETATVDQQGRVPVQFTASAATAQASILTIATAGDTIVANGSQKHKAEVAANDAQGNPAPGTLVIFRYGPDDAHLTERTIAAGPDGVAVAEFASRRAITYVVHAEVAGAPVTNSPQNVAFVAGPFDAERTLASFEVEDATALATGTHELYAKMCAQDAEGNPIEDQTLGFELTKKGQGAVFTPLADGKQEASGASGAGGCVT
ncbi:MAG: Ig-like domain-containing protein, partial [Bifidobacteriaceae bacterium]|nr:Ig-like domain-containing protein [Bifidobacteriaceae bacterium]